jgi:hypothetical protein
MSPGPDSRVDDARAADEVERDFRASSMRRWQRAYDIVRAQPNVDVGDVYHALRCLELSPAERLRRGLSRGRLRTYAR